MVTRFLIAQRLFSIQDTILWADSAYAPSNVTGVVCPPMGIGAAARFGGGHTTGQSYDPGEHPTG